MNLTDSIHKSLQICPLEVRQIIIKTVYQQKDFTREPKAILIHPQVYNEKAVQVASLQTIFRCWKLLQNFLMGFSEFMFPR